MEAAIDRIMQTYDLLANRSAAASTEARAKVTEYSRRCSKPARRTPIASPCAGSPICASSTAATIR
jgi:hypothetical protein